MVRLSLLIALLTAALVACGSPVRMDGASVREQYGRLVVDDVPLEHRREVPVQGVLAESVRAAGLRLGSHTGLVDLVGGPGETFEFMVVVESELEGDGEVQLVDGELRVRSLDGGTCVINGIRGRLPEGVSLDVISGTGPVRLEGFRGAARLRVESGVGELHLGDVDAARLELHSGTGNVQLDGVHAEALQLALGTGVLMAARSELGDVQAESGTGDFLLKDCRVQRGRFRSGTGSLRLVGSHVGHLERSLGTGALIESSAPPEPAEGELDG